MLDAGARGAEPLGLVVQLPAVADRPDQPPGGIRAAAGGQHIQRIRDLLGREPDRPRSELLCHQRVTLVEIAAAEDIASHRDFGVLPGQTTFSGGAGTGNRTPDLLITSYRLIVGAHGRDRQPDRGVCLLIAATTSAGVRLLTRCCQREIGSPPPSSYAIILLAHNGRWS